MSNTTPRLLSLFMRTRITITINQNLLKNVEELIDQHNLRNRSQVIEHLLRQQLFPQIQTAVILAGGPGTQLPAHQGQPAALIPIQSQPLIHHTLTHLKSAGFKHIILCINRHDLPAFKKILGNLASYHLKLSFSTEIKPLGTGGALRHASKLIPPQPFLLLHADILTNINLHQFSHFYQSQSRLAAVAIKPRPGKLSYGRVFVEGHNVVDYRKPKTASPVSLINTGIYIFDHSCLSLLPQKADFNLESTLLPRLIKQQQLTAYTFQGIWYDITNSQDYQEASKRLQHQPLSQP